MFLQDAFGFVKSSADGNSDEIVLGHDRADQLRVILLETQIAIGEDASQARTARNRKTGDAVLGHDLKSLTKSDIRRNGNRVDNHAAFGALYAIDFFGLMIDFHVAMDDPDAALAGDGDGQMGLGDSIHRGGSQRNIQRELAGEASASVDIGGQDGRFAGYQQDVVKGEGLGDDHNVVHRVLTWNGRGETAE